MSFWKILSMLTCILTAMASEANQCWCHVLHPAPGMLEAKRAARQAQIPILRAALAAETQLDVIDVLIAFDASSAVWLAENGKGTPSDYARSCVDKMNECLANSGLREEFSFRLAGTVELSVDASRLSADTMQNSLDVLNSLINNYGNVVAKGEWRKITDRREEVGADIVSVLIDNGSAGCMGLGYSLEDSPGESYSRNLSLIPEFGDFAYNVVSIRAADSGCTQVHEIGHNMGCGHPDASCASDLAIDLGPQLFSHSSGYYFWNGGIGYYTIMGYNFGGKRSDGSYSAADRFTSVPCFSSPNLTYEGHVLGTTTNDNVSTLRKVYKYVAQYRASKIAPTPVPPAPVTPEPGPTDDGLSGKFHPEKKALNAVYPYVGAVYDSAQKVKGIIQLKVGKASKAGISKVAATIIGLDGKKSSAKAVSVDCGERAKAPPAFVKGWGELDLILGENGFIGKLEGGYTVKTAKVGGTLAVTQLTFHFMSEFDFRPPDDGYDLLSDVTPEGERISVSSGTKWMLNKAASVKYRKIVDDKKQKLSHYELMGCGENIDPAKPNVSGLKLSYAAKTGIVKGSFKALATNEAVTPPAKSPKIKKYTVNVNGLVVDNVCIGTAFCKKPECCWSILIK